MGLFKRPRSGDVLECVEALHKGGDHNMNKGELCTIISIYLESEFIYNVTDSEGLPWSVKKDQVKRTKKAKEYQKLRDQRTDIYRPGQLVEIVVANNTTSCHGVPVGEIVRIACYNENSKRFPYTVVDRFGGVWFVASNQISETKKSKEYAKQK